MVCLVGSASQAARTHKRILPSPARNGCPCRRRCGKLYSPPGHLWLSRSGCNTTTPSRAWSKPFGCSSRLRERADSATTATLAWDEFLQTEGALFLWEAFVSREVKTGSHHGDAAVAVEAFCRALPDPRRVNVIDEPRVFSLIGAALLRAGWGRGSALS